MKFIKIMSLMLVIMCFAESSTYAMFSGSKPEGSRSTTEKSYCDQSKIQDSKVTFAEISQVIADHSDLMNISEGKDIVVVLGNTGSGKSATLDWLAGKSLKANRLGDRIELADPKDFSALPIGTGDKSQTKYPQPIKINDTEFFDLPGFRDSSGTKDELLSAAFIKQILEKAKSVKIMFVVGNDSVTDKRAESIKSLLRAAKNMLGEAYEDVIQNSCLFIMSKSDYLGEDLVEFIKESVSKESCPILYKWLKNKKVFPVRTPVLIDEYIYEISDVGKTDILEALSKCEGRRLSDLNLSGFYSSAVKETLAGVFNEIFSKKFDENVSNAKKLNTISDCSEAIKSFERGDSDKDSCGKSFWDCFDESVAELKEIKLLKPLAQDVFYKTYKEFRETNEKNLQLCISDLKTRLECLQNDFISKLKLRMNAVAFSKVDELKKQINFHGKGIDEAKSKKAELDLLSDYEIKGKIMLAVQNDEKIKSMVDEDKAPNSELYAIALDEFCKNDIKQFVKEVRDCIYATNKLCDKIIEKHMSNKVRFSEMARDTAMQMLLAMLKQTDQQQSDESEEAI